MPVLETTPVYMLTLCIYSFSNMKQWTGKNWFQQIHSIASKVICSKEDIVKLYELFSATTHCHNSQQNDFLIIGQELSVKEMYKFFV